GESRAFRPRVEAALMGRPAEKRRRALFRLSTQDRGLDLPLHPLLRGRGTVHGDRSHAARPGAVRHEPGVERARLAGGETEQQVELALGERLWPIDTLVSDDEVSLIGVSAGERAVGGEGVQESLNLRLRTLPGGRTVVLEQYPAGTLLDAR